MTTHTISLESEIDELAALRKAVALMGFDPQRLAAFVADRSDFACKSILLSSMAHGAANPTWTVAFKDKTPLFDVHMFGAQDAEQWMAKINAILEG